MGELLGHIPVIHNTVSKIVRDRVKAGFLLKPNSFSLISSTQRNGIIRIEKALCFSVAQRTSLKGALHEFFLLQMVEKKKKINEEPSISENDRSTLSYLLVLHSRGICVNPLWVGN